MTRPFATPALAALLLLAPACSEAGEPAAPASERPTPGPVASASAPAAPAPRRKREPAPAEAGSRVLGKRDFALRGAPACEIRFVYAGHEPENLFWEESCAAVTAKMTTRPELESLGRWERLDDHARGFVAALPGGRVLYVEGGFSASVYPIGTTGTTYEVPVAD